MKLHGITVDKKIDTSCRLDFCCDDEMKWVMLRKNKRIRYRK